MSARYDYPVDSAGEQYETMCDEIDRLRALAVDLWDELMAWHFDDCPFPDSPMGAPDDQCICHRDLLATYTEVVES